MKGLVCHGAKDVRYEDCDDPKLSEPEDVIVKMTHCALCGSDVHLYEGGGQVGVPFRIGHESVGEIIEVGSGVRDRKVGDKVFMPAATGCGHCPSCLKGKVIACETYDYLRCYGVEGELQGVQSEKLLVHNADYNARLIPEGVTEEQALLLTDILPTAWMGCINADVKPGSTVVVIGLGPVGLLMVECAVLLGAGRVFALDLVPERQAMAKKLGAILLDTKDPGSDLAAATKGKMAECVIEAVGATATIDIAFELVGKFGVVNIMTAAGFSYPLQTISSFLKNLTVRIGVCSVPLYLDAIIPLIQMGRLKPEHVFTHRMKLSEGALAYHNFVHRLNGTVKTILTP